MYVRFLSLARNLLPEAMLVKKVSGQEPDKQHGSVENLWAAATWNRETAILRRALRRVTTCLGKMNEKQSKPAQILRASFRPQPRLRDDADIDDRGSGDLHGQTGSGSIFSAKIRDPISYT